MGVGVAVPVCEDAADAADAAGRVAVLFMATSGSGGGAAGAAGGKAIGGPGDCACTCVAATCAATAVGIAPSTPAPPVATPKGIRFIFPTNGGDEKNRSMGGTTAVGELTRESCRFHHECINWQGVNKN